MHISCYVLGNLNLYSMNLRMPLLKMKTGFHNYNGRRTFTSIYGQVFNKGDSWLYNNPLSKNYLLNNQLITTKRSFNSYNYSKYPKCYLMSMECIIKPRIIYHLAKYIRGYLIINQHYDKDFRWADFKEEATDAFVQVSMHLSMGNFDCLGKIIESKALKEVKRNYEKLDAIQQSNLKSLKDDIHFAYPYHLAIFSEPGYDGKGDRTFMEVMMLFHYHPHYFETVSLKSTMAERLQQHTERVMVANYRFIREITKGVDDFWIINALNHFKPYEAGNLKSDNK